MRRDLRVDLGASGDGSACPLNRLVQVDGSRKAAITILGISERALRYKLKAYREQDTDLAMAGVATTDSLMNASP